MIAALPQGGVEQLDELRELLLTAGVDTVGASVQHRDQPHPNTYLGPGKLDELKDELKRADANVVACDDELSARQERNLEEALGVPVIDRTAVILDIFAAHAHSAEGKLQVELAQLQYNLARMRGLWTHLERLGGGVGTRGPGETQIETDRRLARDRISALKRKLAQVRSNRGVMRAERERAQFPQVALAGYTNAGKSTLLNALTGSEIGVGDRLFHTLDPTTRVLRAGGRDYLLTDTVGFIRKLPHQLVEAFGATLEETRLADLILHIVDGSAPEDDRTVMIRAVEDVLARSVQGRCRGCWCSAKSIGSTRGPRRTAPPPPGRDPDLSRDRRGTARADGGYGARVRTRLRPVELLIPFSEGARLAELHAIAGDLLREDTADGVRVRSGCRLPVAARFAHLKCRRP